MVEDFERCYRAVRGRDTRFDGWFVTAVTSTGVYCRPSCPAMTPRRPNVRFFATAAGAQGAGFRACLRCRPDAVPGSPEWDARADLAGRAMRLIADGVVDREGVAGLARRLGYGERHLHRRLREQVGAGPRALARAQRAHAARLLAETTDMPLSQVAFAAGFGSLRQFNDVVREVFGRSPGALRAGAGDARHDGRRDGAPPGGPTAVSLRLALRAPFDRPGLAAHLARRAVPGVEEMDGDTYRRTLRLPGGPAVAELSLGDEEVRCRLRLADLRDLQAGVARCRRLLDLDADPRAVGEALAADPLLAPLVARSPGRRVPGAVDGVEAAARAVLGQQITVAGARTRAARLAARRGTPLPAPDGTLTHLFPDAAAIARASAEDLPMPGRAREALRGLARALAAGALRLDPGADRREARARLVALPGIGPWTAEYVALRALGDPDAFPASDLGLRRALERAGLPGDPAAATRRAERWRPWRAYAAQHLWSAPIPDAKGAP